MANAGWVSTCPLLLSTRTILISCLLMIALAARMVQQSVLAGSLDGRKGSRPCRPTEVHLAVADNNRDISATWRTRGTGCPSTVSYGLADTAGGRLTTGTPLLISDGSSYTISEALMCAAPATSKPFTVIMHTAVMSMLEPGARYWYSLGDSDLSWTFRAPPLPGADRPFSFIAFGDMGESIVKARKIPKAAQTVKAIAAELVKTSPELILHVGDLAYADGKFTVWDSFMEQIEPLASKVPYMVSIGNHEAGPCSSGNDLDPSGERPYKPDWGNYGSESGGECGAMAAHRFVMPGQEGLEARGGAFASAAAMRAEALVPATTATASTFPASENGGKAPKPVPESRSGSVGSNSRAAVRRRQVISSRRSSNAISSAQHLRWEEPHAASVPGVAPKRPVNSTNATEGERSEDYGKIVDNHDEEEEKDAVPVAAKDNASASDPPAVDRPGSTPRRLLNPPFWYSFDYGSVHFVMLSSEHNLEHGSTQHSWLRADLACVDRCRTPWVIVGLHRPMYVVYPHKDNRVVGDHIRNSIEDLLLTHQVDLVLSGHVHTYYRSCSAAGGECAANEREGVVHLVLGTAGHELSNVEDDQKDWCDEVINDWGFGRFDVDGDMLHVSFIRSQSGHVADSFTLRSKVAPGEACDRGEADLME